jgi:hypothetical protein
VAATPIAMMRSAATQARGTRSSMT